MKTAELDYELPKELIATHPLEPRDAARLLVLDRKKGTIVDSHFSNLGHFFRKGDVLVLNQTKVFPARIFSTKESGGKVEVVFLKEVSQGLWEVIIGGKASDGQKLIFTDDFSGIVRKDLTGNFLEVSLSKLEVFSILEEIGQMPLPPYMNRGATKEDKADYQTIFAEKTGSAAAPTAGLHFTEKLLAELQRMGVQLEYITLHVGLGTFAPVKTETLEEHPIHSEYYEIEGVVAKQLNKAKKEGRRIIACGTTVMRTLESASQVGEIIPAKGETKLFIYPGYDFKFVDGLITNFHTPKSSLLALVYTFAGTDNVRAAYAHAIKERYRFFSYGDGMLII